MLFYIQDTLKKLDQHVDDHSQYKDAHSKAANWLSAMKQRLTGYSDTGDTADKEQVQEQLENLHELIVMKDEGQTLLHSANTWGEKTLVTTSVEGRSDIQRQLQVLQEGWDSLMSGTSDVRVALESQLLQWSQFDDNFQQIQRWLKDMERKTGDAEPKADLGEKRAQLQKTKVCLSIDLLNNCQNI